jgi:pheromone shutdown-related protein TraB
VGDLVSDGAGDDAGAASEAPAGAASEAPAGAGAASEAPAGEGAASEAPAGEALHAVGDHVAVLRSGSRTTYLVGTAHVSEASVREVEDVIERLQPDTVCVELCQARYDALTDEDRWKKLDIFEVIKGGKALFLMANLGVSAYQRRLGDQLGVKPGAELLAGAEKARQIGAELRLVDRDINVTLKRTWANLGFWSKMQLLGAVMGSFGSSSDALGEEDIEKLKEPDNLSSMMAEFAKVMPEVKIPLIDERDQYLMSAIEEAPGETVVAVVGAGHVDGMRRWFGRPVDRAALEVIAPPKRWVSLLKWVIPAIILAAFYFGYSKSEGKTFEEMLWAWILPNAVFAAVLTALALAKPLSILAAAVASPITSLNPLLGAGMVVGLLEAWLRKPTVEDCENISQDVQTLRGWYRNPFTRVLLVALMSTLGSALGAWVGLGWVVSLL